MREIYDEYCKDYERQRQEEASKQRPGAKKAVSTINPSAAAAAASASSSSAQTGDASSSSIDRAGRHDSDVADPQWAALEAMLDKMRIMDRMVNQNTFADVAMDFKYWDDTSDALRWGTFADTMGSKWCSTQ